MKAPLLQRLEARLEVETDPEERAVVFAKIACYSARIGDFEQSSHIRAALRTEFGDGRFARVSVLLMCIEALESYYGHLGLEARDRLMRANLISVALKQAELSAFTAAWLAHIDFNQGRYDSMVRSLDSCRQLLTYDDGTARCRMAQVLTDAFLFCGQPSIARRWFEVAHATATSLGDRAAIGALTYNQAALGVHRARLAALKVPCEESDLKLLEQQVATATNYQAGAGLRSLEHLLREASIGVAILRKDYGTALLAISTMLEQYELPSATATKSQMLADYVMCLAKLGDHKSAIERAGGAFGIEAPALTDDDMALFLHSKAEYLETIGDASQAAAVRSQAADALQAHSRFLSGVRELLTDFENP
jgi:tetratricopeptide (TPR) repeat protein